MKISRRRLIGWIGVGAGGALLSGCDRISASAPMQRLLGFGQGVAMRAQRIITDRAALAPEYTASQMSPVFRTNGNTMPNDAGYQAHAARRLVDWRLSVGGLVSRPLARITRHDCVEGWSAIGQWTGVPLRLVPQAAGLKSSARYIVFHCADDFDGTFY